MKHYSTQESNFRPANCYKRVYTDCGVFSSYSICIGNHEVSKEYIDHVNRIIEPIDYIQKFEVVNVTKTFKKTPYKQTRKVEYTQTFHFLKVTTYHPYNMINGFADLYHMDMSAIKEFINTCLHFNVNLITE